jgi:DNA (cytosine-5)-methyltransferase 1
MRRLLDAFSCAAIGAGGYDDAGFDEIVCLDNDPKALRFAKDAGYETVCGDAMALLNDAGFMGQFDAIHASPPCQGFSATRELARAQGKGNSKRTVDLLRPVIDLFDGLDTPYVIENVERSPLRGMPGVVRLCGSSFGLKVQRHRLFLSNVPITPLACRHDLFDADPITGKPRPWGVYYAKGDNIPSGGRTCETTEDAMACMGVTREVPWKYLCEGLPPAYTEHIGRHLLAHLEEAAA